MVIAIPTFKRETIQTLDSGILSKFKPKNIYIFPNNYEREEMYSEVNRFYNKYPTVNIKGLETKGIPAARNAILNFFKNDEEIVMLDDDITAFMQSEPNKKTAKMELREMTPQGIKEFFKYAFGICRKNQTKLWGIYPIDNPFFMKNQINPKGFCIGTAFGIINSDIRYDPGQKLKEDYEITLRHIIKYHKVARFDYITVKAGHYSNAGGCVKQRKDNPELEKEMCDFIIKKYPTLLRRNPNRENEILIAL